MQDKTDSASVSAVEFDAIPPTLAARAQWLVWRFESKPGDKKPRKVPYYVSGTRRTGEQGSDADRAALVDLPTARAAVDKAGTRWTGVGFAFLPGDGLIGVDLDGMFDPATGLMTERGAAIIVGCDSYTEFSPSGKGVHIICSGETETFKSNEVGVEVFCGRQFFTFTGKRYPGTAAEVNALPAKVLKRLKATVESGKKRAATGKPSTAPAPALEGRAKVESALAFISPECGYDDWIHIGMAICSELGTGAFDVFDAWSAKSAKYAGSDQCMAHWKSFKPAAAGDKAFTGATIFKLAMDAGWQPPKPPKAARARAQPDGGGKPSARSSSIPDDMPDWRKKLIYDKGDLKACLANVYDILLNDSSWQGVLAFDEFAQRTVKRTAPPYQGGVAGEWDGTDDSRTAMWLARAYRFTPSSIMVAEAVEVLGRAFAFHPVRDWLKALKWDGVARIDQWLADYLGVAITDYTKRVAAWFLLGMIARVMRPGVKFDYCLVFEGIQGRGKSTTLSILGGEWFGDTDIDLHNKDSMAALQGKWLYEFPELGSLARTESLKQKSFLSRQVDEYRPVYGRRQIKVPRQTVFSGSTNEWEWNKDPTGGRRFWPIEVGDIDLDGLAKVRDQLFAEAYVRYQQGERFYPTGEEQRLHFDPEQLKREQGESLVDALHDWVFEQYKPFSVAMAAFEGLKVSDASKLTRDMQTRIGIALRKLGCRRVEKRNGMTRYWYTAPPKDDDQASKETASPARETARVGDVQPGEKGKYGAPF